MKRLSVVGAIFASFVLGAAMNAVAQEEHRNDKQQAAQPAERQEQARPQAQQEERRNQDPQNYEERRQEPRQDERQMQQQDRHQQEQMKQQEKQQQRMDKQQEKMDRQQGREQDRQQPMQGGQAQARPQRAQNQRHISDRDFHAHFGREHRFAPGRMQVVDGRQEFTYSGYVFELVNVWPTDWAYDADDYYVDYLDDEYWLCSFSHPEMRLELIIIG